MMTFYSTMVIIAVSFTITGIFIYIKEDFAFVPNLFYKNLKKEDEFEFIKNYGKGVFLTGFCLICVLVDFSGIEAVRFTLFGFTLAYSDLYLKKARKLAHTTKVKSNVKLGSKNRFKSKYNRTIASIGVAGTVVLGIYFVGAFMILANNKPFKESISLDEVETASIYLKPIDSNKQLTLSQLEEFIYIFSDIVVYEELAQPTFLGEPITYTIEINDGSVYEIGAMGNYLFIKLNDDFKSYIIHEDVTEELIYFATSL